MLTTTSKSVNSKRWGVSASRSSGPISGSRSIIANTSSMHSRSSRADSNEAATTQLLAVSLAAAGGVGVVVAVGAGVGVAVAFLAAAGLRVAGLRVAGFR